MTKPSVTKSNDRSAENSCVLCVIISFNCIASGKGFQIFVVFFLLIPIIVVVFYLVDGDVT